MEIDRRLRLWGLVVAQAGDEPASVPDVCAVTVAVSGVDAAAITVMLAATPRETLYTSGRLAADLEEITLTLGEGPGVDASAGGGPALAADLAGVRLPDPLAGVRAGGGAGRGPGGVRAAAAGRRDPPRRPRALPGGRGRAGVAAAHRRVDPR